MVFISSKNTMRFFLLLFLLIIAVFWQERAEGLFEKNSPKSASVMRVVIDPGHGGADPGAVLGHLKESDINMNVSLALKQKLENRGFQVILTRVGDKGLVPEKKMSYFARWLILKKRKQYAELVKANILISIHVNSNEDTSVSGAMVFYSDPKSKRLAEMIQNSLNEPGGKNRRAFHSNFTVIMDNPMPSILVEAGFITNKKDRKTLVKKYDQIAADICDGILEYFPDKMNDLHNKADDY